MLYASDVGVITNNEYPEDCDEQGLNGVSSFNLLPRDKGLFLFEFRS